MDEAGYVKGEPDVNLEKQLSDGTFELMPVKDLGGWTKPLGTVHTMDLELKEEIEMHDKETYKLLQTKKAQ